MCWSTRVYCWKSLYCRGLYIYTHMVLRYDLRKSYTRKKIWARWKSLYTKAVLHLTHLSTQKKTCLLVFEQEHWITKNTHRNLKMCLCYSKSSGISTCSKANGEMIRGRSRKKHLPGWRARWKVTELEDSDRF